VASIARVASGTLTGLRATRVAVTRTEAQLFALHVAARSRRTARAARRLAREIERAPRLGRALLLANARVLLDMDRVHRDDLRILARRGRRWWALLALLLAGALVRLAARGR
jgi:hypothetical protein